MVGEDAGAGAGAGAGGAPGAGACGGGAVPSPAAADIAGTAAEDAVAATAELSLGLDPIEPEPGERQP